MKADKKKVIIVEDDPFTQNFYGYIFKKAGLDYLITEDCTLLFEELSKSTVGLVIIDISLKNTYFNNERINGVELCKLIKQESKYAQIPILVITAYVLPEDEIAYIRENFAFEYIQKPIIDVKNLINKVNKIMADYGEE